LREGNVWLVLYDKLLVARVLAAKHFRAFEVPQNTQTFSLSKMTDELFETADVNLIKETHLHL